MELYPEGFVTRNLIRLVALALMLAGGCQAAREGAAPQPLRAYVDGEGTPLVMLGGGTAGAGGFARHAEDLSKDFRVIRLESLRMEGARSGRSLPQGYSINTESAAMAAALDRLGIDEPFHLVGHSFGALMALDFALDHPQRVRSLVLAEPPAFWVVPPEDMRNSDMGAMVELTRTLGPADEPTDHQLTQFQERLGKSDAQPPVKNGPDWEVWVAKRRALRGLSAVPNHTDDPKRLRAFGRPVLIVTGKSTVAFHRRINDVLASDLPQAERVELDGGHAAPSTDPPAFVAAVRAFLARHSGQLSGPR